MAVMTYTKNLRIPLISGEDHVTTNTFNAPLLVLDEVAVGVSHLSSRMHWEMWKAETRYSKGDIVRTESLGSSQYLECIISGTSDTATPVIAITGTSFDDGTVRWIVRSLASSATNSVEIWLGGGYYSRGQLVLHYDILYRVRKDHVAAATFKDDLPNLQTLYSNIRLWQAGDTYSISDSVIFEGNIYRCAVANTDASFTDSHWERLGDTIVSDYADSTSYLAGELVRSNGKLYISKSSHTSPATGFKDDAANWEKVYAEIAPWAEKVDYIKDDLAEYDNIIYRCIKDHTSSRFSADITNWRIYHTPNAFIRDWQAGATYEPGQVTIYGDNTYQCTVGNSNQSFNSKNWKCINSDVKNWKTGTQYSVGELVINDGKLYQCNTSHTSSTFKADETFWLEIGSGKSIISEWEDNKNYTLDTVISYKRKLFRCTTAHTSATNFDHTKWESLYAAIPEWEKDTLYVVGDVVDCNNVLYYSKDNHQSCSTAFFDDISHWGYVQLINAILTEWTTNTLYEVNQLVTHDDKIWICTTRNANDTSFKKASWRMLYAPLKPWEGNNTEYEPNQYVSYNGAIYRSLASHKDVLFNPAEWEKLTNSGVPVWTTNITYSVDELVQYNNKIYRCVKAHTSTVFDIDEANWVLVTNTAEWATNTFYKAGSLVLYNTTLYYCITTHTSTTTIEADMANWRKIAPSITIGDFEASTKYEKNTPVLNDGVIYRTNNEHISGTSFVADEANWDIVFANTRDWAENTYYKQGSTVVYGDVIYKCLKAHSSTAQLAPANINYVQGYKYSRYEGIAPSKVYDLGQVRRFGCIYGNPGNSSGDFLTAMIVSVSINGTDYVEVGRCPYNSGGMSVYADVMCRYVKIEAANGVGGSFDTFSGVFYIDNYWERLCDEKANINVWSASTDYNKNDIVYYNHKLYRALYKHTSGTTKLEDDAGYWECLSDEFSLPEWKPSTHYPAGYCVLYDDHLYRCLLEHYSSTKFFTDSTKWIEVGGVSAHLLTKWQATTDYIVTELVEQSGIMMKSLQKHTSSNAFSTDVAKWGFVNANIVEWKTGEYYKKGATVYYDGHIYRCLVDHTETLASPRETNYVNAYSRVRGHGWQDWDLKSIQRFGYFTGDPQYMSGSGTVDVSVSVDGTNFTSIATYEYAPNKAIGIYADVMCQYIRLTPSSGISNGFDYVSVYYISDIWERIDHQTAAIQQWSYQTEYWLNDVVIYKGKLYRAIAYKHTSGTTKLEDDAANWEELVGSGGSGSTSISDWVASTEYKVGDFVLYDNSTGINNWASGTAYTVGTKAIYANRVFNCTTANNDTQFTHTNWEQLDTVRTNIYKCKTKNTDATFTESHWDEINKNILGTFSDIDAMF